MVGFIAEEAKLWKFGKSKQKTAEEAKLWKFGKSKQKTAEEEEKIQEDAEKTEQNRDGLEHYLPKTTKPWWKTRHLLVLNWLILIVSLTSTNTGYDGSLLNAFQSMPDWMSAMGQPTGAVLGAMSNGVVFGVLLSTLVASTISDRLGRRHAITIGDLIMVVGTIIQSCAGTWLHVTGDDYQETNQRTYAMFLVARIILGFGNGLATIASPPLISELSYPTHRQAVTAFFNSNWYLGAIISSWVSFGTRNVGRNWSWRIPSIVQGFFPLAQICLIYFVPESPRFLISKGRNSEAREILLKYHGGGDEAECGALVDFEMSEIELAIEQEKYANNFSYMSFFKTPGNRKRLFILSFLGIIMQLSGNGLVSYYLSIVLDSIGITSTSQQLIFNGGLMIYNYGICIIINLFAHNHTKRRTIFITSVASMLLTYVIWTILSAINQQRNFEDSSLGKGVMAMIFLYYLAYNLGLNGLPYLYLTEILPFTIRTKGINLCVLVQQIIQIYNGFVNPIAMDAIEWRYYIVYCCILAVELVVVYLTWVETSGRTLEEVVEVFGESITDHDIEHLRRNKATVEHRESVSSDGDNAEKSSSAERENNLLA